MNIHPTIISRVCTGRFSSSALRLGRKYGLSQAAIREIWATYPELIPPRVKPEPPARIRPQPRAAEFGIIAVSRELADGVTVSLSRVRWTEREAGL